MSYESMGQGRGIASEVTMERSRVKAGGFVGWALVGSSRQTTSLSGRPVPGLDNRDTAACLAGTLSCKAKRDVLKRNSDRFAVSRC